MTKQVYSPVSIIFHDYAKDEEHFNIKKQKQLESIIRLKSIHLELDKYIEKWKEIRCTTTNLNRKSSKEKLNQITEKVWERNIKQIKEIGYGKVFTFDKKAIENIKSKVKNYKYRVIFGAGNYGSEVLNILRKKNITINFITDNDANKWGNDFQGVQIINPDLLHEDCFIFIASTWYFEIEEQLKEMNLKKNKNYVVIIN